MAIKISQAFERTSAQPIDASLAYTKAQMVAVNDNLMPDYYFTVCQDDGKIYMYDKTATATVTTGKFKELETGGGSGDVQIFTTTEDLSKEINDTTVVAAADLPGVTWSDLKVGASIIKDANGTFGVVTTITGTTSVTVTTATTSTPTVELTQAQYDALVLAGTVDPETLYFITDATPVLPASPNLKYSTSEQVVGTWIDGKPLYQRTMVCENPTNDWNTCPYVNGETIANMDTKVHTYVIMEYHNSPSDTTPRFTECPLVYGNSSNNTIIENLSALPSWQSVRFQWIGQNTRIVDRLWCTLQYTKTTD